MSQNGEVFGGLSGSGASRVAGILSRGEATRRREEILRRRDQDGRQPRRGVSEVVDKKKAGGEGPRSRDV